MAFKEGSNGRNIWSECEKHGIAAVGYRRFAKYGDLSKYNEDEFDEICRRISAPVSIRASVASTSKCRIIRGTDDIFGDITGLTQH